MTTFSFNIEESEVAKLKVVLKAFGAKNLKIQDDEAKMSKEEFYAEIDKSIKDIKDGKGIKYTPELKKEIFKGIL